MFRTQSKLVFIVILLQLIGVSARATCPTDRVVLQVLGSGGPELDDQRASSSYLLWVDDKARLLVDLGAGASLRFGESGAAFEDIDAIALSHLHVDHSADLPAFVKGSFFTERQRDLLILGPAANELMPATSEFVHSLFAKGGSFAYLSNFIDPTLPSAYQINTKDVALDQTKPSPFTVSPAMRLTALPVHHGPIAALAWRVDVLGCSVSFSGDMNNEYGTLEKLAAESDLLIMHNAVPESAQGIAAHLHMRPSQIGRIAQNARTRRLLISHRMKRTLGKEVETERQIRKAYSGPIHFANDLDRFDLGD